MIDLKKLIQVAPFSEDTRGQLLASVGSLSPEKKFELTNMCWAFISQEYQNKLQFALQKATFEMAKGEKSYTQEDFKKIEDDLFAELVARLQAADSSEQIEELRDKLSSQTSPLSTDNRQNKSN